MLGVGDTFISPVPKLRAVHLNIVLTDPDPDNRSVVVNVTTLKSLSDRTVVCGLGDHQYITHPSVIAYVFATMVDLVRLDDGLRTRLFGIRQDPTCSPDFLDRVKSGFLDSPETPEPIYELCQRLWSPAE